VSQTILIVAISVIAAVVVGSSVFFVWTLVQRLIGRASPDVIDDEQQSEVEESEQTD